MWALLLAGGKGGKGETPVIYGFEWYNELGRVPRGEPESARPVLRGG